MSNPKQRFTPSSRATTYSLLNEAGRWLLLILLGVGAAAAVISTADKLSSLWLQSLRSRFGPLHVFVATHVLLMLTWMLTKTKGSIAAQEEAREDSLEASRQIMSYIFDPSPNEQWVVRNPSSETCHAMPKPLQKAPRPAVTSTVRYREIKEDKKDNDSMDAVWKKIKGKASSSKPPAILRKPLKVLRDDDLSELMDDYIKKREDHLRIERRELEQRQRRLEIGTDNRRQNSGLERQTTDEFHRRAEAFIEKQRNNQRLERHHSELRRLAAEGGKSNLN